MSGRAAAVSGGSTTRAHELRILVVDDVADIRLLLRLALDGDARLQVVGEARDGAEAITAVSQLRPDVVLLDLAMPVMDGLEALPEIRALSPETKIVVLSGFNAREMSAEALRLGASSYLEKGDIATRLVPHVLGLFPDHEHPHAVAPTVVAAPLAEGARLAAPGEEPVGDVTEEWVAALAHELNNPVTILQGLAMILQQATDSMSPAAIKESAAAIGRSAKHLGALIESFSDLRKVEVDSLDLVLEPTDVSELVRETVTDMAEVTSTHPVIVEVVEGVVTSIDPLRVRQVLINLLANAAKFSPTGTRIDVRVILDGGNVEISVCDHGPGIPAAKLSELFRKFSRLDPDVHGTGIGLFLSRGIARAHGGDLILAGSSAPGCKFVLRLPLVRGVDPPTPTRTVD